MARRPSIARAVDGFTMVELLIVVVVLGTLATLTVSQVTSRLRHSAEQSACKADRAAIQIAEELIKGYI